MTSARFFAEFRRTLTVGGAWAVLGFLVLPMFIVLPVSLTDTTYISLPQEKLSLQHYKTFFTDGVWLPAAFQSFIIAIASTCIALVLGVLCAIGCWRLSNEFSNGVRLLLLMPMIIPPVVQGLAYFRLFAALDIYDSYLGMIIAHSVFGLPFVVIVVSASLANFDPKLEHAAYSLGGSTSQTIRLVLLPNILPGMLSGGLFAFVHSFDELIIALFVTSYEINTLPKRLWDGVRENITPTIAAAAVVLICTTLTLFLITYLVGQLRARQVDDPLADPESMLAQKA